MSRHVVGAAIIVDDRCLVAERGPGMTLSGKWEFPGGKVEPREHPRAALAREIKEELGLEIEVGDWLGRGEAIQLDHPVTLDVYAASKCGGILHMTEHARTRWFDAADLYALDWAAADIPVLPAVRSYMEADGDSHRTWPRCVVSADWGKHADKRAVWVARRTTRSWIVAREAPPADGWNFATLLDLGRRLKGERHGPVLIGIDAAIGVPLAFTRAAGFDCFLDALASLAKSGGLTHTCTAPGEWAPQRPFFHVPPGAGGMSRFVQSAGGQGTLMRQIDLRTGAKPVFAVSGIPGTVGSGSRSIWSELAAMLDGGDREFGVWPFAGSLSQLLGGDRPIVAETYPRAACAIALSDALPAKPRSIAKTRRAARVAAVDGLRRASWLAGRAVELRDLEFAASNEDDFDAMMTAAGILRLCIEKKPLSSAITDPAAEGGILATGMIEFSRNAPRFHAVEKH